MTCFGSCSSVDRITDIKVWQVIHRLYRYRQANKQMGHTWARLEMYPLRCSRSKLTVWSASIPRQRPKNEPHEIEKCGTPDGGENNTDSIALSQFIAIQVGTPG
jgi:hypothetical protein